MACIAIDTYMLYLFRLFTCPAVCKLGFGKKYSLCIFLGQRHYPAARIELLLCDIAKCICCYVLAYSMIHLMQRYMAKFIRYLTRLSLRVEVTFYLSIDAFKMARSCE